MQRVRFRGPTGSGCRSCPATGARCSSCRRVERSDRDRMGVGRCEDAARRNLGRHLAFDPGGVVGRDVQSLRDVVALRRSWGVGSTRGQSACDRCRRPGQLRFDGPRRCDDVTGADHDLDGGPGPILDDRDRADHLRHHDGDFAVDEQCGPVDVHAARSGGPFRQPAAERRLEPDDGRRGSLQRSGPVGRVRADVRQLVDARGGLDLRRRCRMDGSRASRRVRRDRFVALA